MNPCVAARRVWQGGEVTSGEPGRTGVRKAEVADQKAIIAIAMATGQDEDWDEVYPGYIRHLMTHGSLLVAERSGVVAGFGATLRIGTGPRAISMLTDLFVDPAAHGTGTGRAILGKLWTGEARRMTFSSLHANALPLYTRFGVVASRDGQQTAAGTVGGAGPEHGISHLAIAPEMGAHAAGDAVIAVLSWLEPADGQARVCLPAPHPATRPLLAAGWRVEEFDLHMASELGLIDPRRLAPSAALA